MAELPLFRAAVIWLVIAALAVANGAIREGLLRPQLGIAVALPLSGISLALIVLLVSYFAINFLGGRSAHAYWLIGVQWVVMTLALEFLFGHFVAGKSWPDLLQTFNLAKGDLFILVLLVSLTAPYLIARLRGVIN